MKLYVGCGNEKLEGYKHLDIIKGKHIDFVYPCWEVPVSDKTFDEIYSRHLFEHLYPWQAEDSLQEWKRILKDDGKIIIVLPNLEFHAKQILMPGKSQFIKKNCSNFDHALYSIYGWLSNDKKNTNMSHKWGYTHKSLEKILSKYFKKIKFKSNEDYRDIEVEAWKE